MEYNPLSLLHKLDDEILLDMVKSGDMEDFCMSLTLDLNQIEKNPEC